MNTLRAASCWIVTLAALILPGFALGADADSVIAIVGFDEAVVSPELAEYTGSVISPESVLVVVPERQARDVLAHAPGRLLEKTREWPLWVTPRRLPEGIIAELEIEVIFRSGTTTVFQAHASTAHDINTRGWPVIRLRLRPLASLFAASLGEDLMKRLVAERPLTQARRAFMAELADSVDTLNLRQDLRWLCRDEAPGGFRSRFAPREELEHDVVPYLTERLGDLVGPHGGNVRSFEFEVELPPAYAGGDETFINIEAGVSGRSTGAYYIVCAHYDAIASHDAGWDTLWTELAAPGADDNATGVVGVLECAEVLAGLDLDFGLKFVLFSGEELGLLGSLAYVTNIASTDTVMGVVNLDMIGYAKERKLIEVTYNWRSEWLSGLVQEAADIVGLESAVRTLNRTGQPVSDHFPFWEKAIPGIMLADSTENGVPIYPYYHSAGDVPANLTMAQIADNVKAVVACIARFAPVAEDTLPDLVLGQSSIEWQWFRRVESKPVVAGESLRVVVRPVNVGGAMQQTETYNLEIWKGEASTGDLIHDGQVELELLSGERAELLFSWETDATRYGNVAYTFVLMPEAEGVEADLGNNSVTVLLETMAQTSVIEHLHVFPNPVGRARDAKLAFDVFHPDGDDFIGEVEVWVYDLLGSQVGHGVLRNSYMISELKVGRKATGRSRNAFDLSRFIGPDEDLPPGLYLCIAELRLVGEAGVWSDRFKFAVAR
jgi:hypothetical protein